MRLHNLIKTFGLIMGIAIIILNYFGKTSEIQWAVGMFLIWGFIYSINDN